MFHMYERNYLNLKLQISGSFLICCLRKYIRLLRGHYYFYLAT